MVIQLTIVKPKALKQNAYTVQSGKSDVPDGIQCHPNFATGSVWDNDANIQTLDGKDTFHATVGHTYQNILPDSESSTLATEFRQERKQRRFTKDEQDIPPFIRPLKKASYIWQHLRFNWGNCRPIQYQLPS